MSLNTGDYFFRGITGRGRRLSCVRIVRRDDNAIQDSEAVALFELLGKRFPRQKYSLTGVQFEASRDYVEIPVNFTQSERLKRTKDRPAIRVIVPPSEIRHYIP